MSNKTEIDGLENLVIFVEPGPQDWITEPLELIELDAALGIYHKLQGCSAARIEELGAQVERQDKEIGALRQRLADAQHDLNNARMVAQVLDGQVAERNTTISELGQRLAEVTGEKEVLRIRVGQLEGELAEAHRDLRRVKAIQREVAQLRARRNGKAHQVAP